MFQVLIIGCGNIAGRLDVNRPTYALPITHAGAFKRHGGFSLEACVDPDDKNRTSFAQYWKLHRQAASLEQIGAREGEFDIISICSPTLKHMEHVHAALALRPRLIFCEKPITPSVLETEALVQACEKFGVLLAVNYTRRWSPDIQILADELVNGTWGKVRSVIATYNKGILNNGSHMIDLLHLLLGALQVEYAGEAYWDFWENDPSIPAMLRAGDVPISLNISHASDYAQFELQIATEKGMLTMEDGGMNWRIRRPIQDSYFSGYRILDEGTRTAGYYPRAMLAAISNLHSALSVGQRLVSDGRSALVTQRTCEQIRKSARGYSLN